MPKGYIHNYLSLAALPAAGMTLERTGQILDFNDEDTMLLIAGSLLMDCRSPKQYLTPSARRRLPPGRLCPCRQTKNIV